MPNPDTTLSGSSVVALVYDGLCTFEFGITCEVFSLSRPELGQGWYRFASVAIEEGPLHAQGGLIVAADSDISLIDSADIIVVPGWRGPHHPIPSVLRKKLCDAYSRGARLVSLCSGAFVLAQTGLLAGATVATHWRYADALRTRHPDISVDESSLYRIHDRIFTAAGSAAGIDLLIEIVRRDYGAAAANSVARRLVIPAHRTGGQAQFLERPVAARTGTDIGPLLDEIRKCLTSNWTIGTMARFCHMSERTLIRRFIQATGSSPAEWLANERIELAKQLLCDSKFPVEEIAQAAGFGNAHSLRHHFRKRLGVSPGVFRSRFIVNDERNETGGNRSVEQR